MLNGVLEIEEASLALGLVPNVGILMAQTLHHRKPVTRSAHYGGEDYTWGIVPRKSSLAHPRAIVNHQRDTSIVIAHVRYR